MRSSRTQLWGEAGRVAQRVRVVVAAGRDADEPLDAPRSPDHRSPPGGRVLARFADRLPVRVDPGRRPALAIAVLVVLVALVTGLWVLSSQPRSMPVSDAAPIVAGASPLAASGSGNGSAPRTRASSTAAPSAAEIVVDVAGKVRRPGLYRLPPGSRVHDALTAAGGALRGVDLASLNLASRLVDGQQIAVGRPGAAVPNIGAGTGSATGPASGGSGQVNLNLATLDQLVGLPGIGPSLGQRILDYRAQRGSFRSVDQLDDVPGIGTATFQRLKPLVTV